MSEDTTNAGHGYIASARERAVFEAGIKLGALYHQFTGAPINLASAESMEQAIQESIALQPHVSSINVRIDRAMINTRLNRFGYCELEGSMLDVMLTTQVEGVRVSARLSYEPELEYPLMKIVSIEEE